MKDRIRILYAEDDPGDAALTRKRFARDASECDLDIVDTGRACMERLVQDDYDLVLTDLQMPDMSALDLLRELRSHGISLPLVIVTGKGNEDVAVAALKMGAYDYVVKRNGYLIQLPHIIGHAIAHFQLEQQIAEHKRAEGSLRAGVRQQAAIAEIGNFALSGAELEQVFNETVAAVARTLDVELCKVLELLPDQSALRLRAGVGWQAGQVGQATVPNDRYSQAGYTLLTDEPVIVRDLRTETRFQGPPLLIDHGVVSGVSVKIAGPVGAFGVLGVHTTSPRTFNADDTNFLQAIANVLANAVARKHAERSVAALERQRRALLEGIEEGIHWLDLTGHIMFENPAALKMFGRTEHEMIGRYAHTLMHHHRPDNSPYPVEECPIYRTLRDGRTRHVHDELFFRKDGTGFPAEYTVSALRDDVGALAGVVVSFRDVTEYRQLQTQFLQSQKLEAVGQLAGGIAHDFNNNLSAILGFSDLALDKLRPGDPLHRYITQVKKAGEQAATLTRQLLAFSRKQLLQPEILGLNALLTDGQMMLQRMVGEHIQLRLLLHPELGRIKADPGQMEQVLMNLVVNARDAMPEGGTLTLQTANIECNEAEAGARPPMLAGSYIRLTVADTGCGMDAATMARIFEPFFTTKEPGKGTGLGLSTAYGIIKQSGGYIWVDSTPGQGATFTIDLPRVETPLEATPAPEVSTPGRRGDATVLLVEDDELVRTIAREALQAYGYTVLEAMNGGAALLISERHEGAIDLLLTDVVMPYMNGRELAQRLTTQRPDMRVLYMSGYTDDMLAPSGVLKPDVVFLPKPFTPDLLLHAVQEAIETPENRAGVA